jgi:hypothetical protein
MNRAQARIVGYWELYETERRCRVTLKEVIVIWDAGIATGRLCIIVWRLFFHPRTKSNRWKAEEKKRKNNNKKSNTKNEH